MNVRIAAGRGVVVLLSALAFWQGNTQPAHLIPPGVPEPGLVLWGNVVNAANPAQSLPIERIAWSVSAGTNHATYDASSLPPTQIRDLDGQHFYLLEIPFDTRRLGLVTLADPATAGRRSFELSPSASPPTYACVATVNGFPASVRAVDGVAGSGSSFSATGFGAVSRGRVIRVDLAITPVRETYEQWAARIWGSATDPEALRTADPDGDGSSNAEEYEAGTNPRDTNSVFRILGITLAADPAAVAVSWSSVSERRYQIESASDVDGEWTPLGAAVSGTGTTAQAGFARDPLALARFYRVRTLPLP